MADGDASAIRNAGRRTASCRCRYMRVCLAALVRVPVPIVTTDDATFEPFGGRGWSVIGETAGYYKTDWNRRMNISAE